jgi:hypothetical protein
MPQDNLPQTWPETEEALERHRRMLRSILQLLTLEEVRELIDEIETAATTQS